LKFNYIILGFSRRFKRYIQKEKGKRKHFVFFSLKNAKIRQGAPCRIFALSRYCKKIKKIKNKSLLF